jgi:hypothetical protein
MTTIVKSKSNIDALKGQGDFFGAYQSVHASPAKFARTRDNLLSPKALALCKSAQRFAERGG